MTARRYARQARLAEIGEAGQARLLAAEVVVQRSGIAGEIEAKYLRAAGMRVQEREEEIGHGQGHGHGHVETRGLGVRDEAAADVAAGAMAALRGMRRVLGMGEREEG